MKSLLLWLENTRLATSAAESPALFPWAEGVHVLALSVVIGTIALVDLRLLGFVMRSRCVSVLMRELLPVTWIAFAVAVTTGLVMFVSQPTMYAENLFFQIKLLLLALIGINVAAFHGMTTRSADRWNSAGALPLPARIAGALSLFLWTAVVVVGRWIGFA